MRTRGRLREALDPLPVHASIAKTMRASLPFAVMLLFGLVPTLLFAGRMYDSICLEMVGQRTIGRVVDTKDFTKNIPEVQRTGNQPTVRATIEYPTGSASRRFEWTGWIHTDAMDRVPKRSPVIGDSLPVRYMDGRNLAMVDRVSTIWLPQALLFPAGMVLLVLGIAFLLFQVASWRRGVLLSSSGIEILVSEAKREEDGSYTDGKHFRLVAVFEVDGVVYKSLGSPTKGNATTTVPVRIVYLPSDPRINRILEEAGS